MTERIEKICSEIPRSELFADVGCDHGYCAEYALKNGLCARAYITDISVECLKKAETLLRDYILAQRCTPVCTDGLNGLPERPDCVLIAGMGGEEIVKILSTEYLPARLLLQPMKNSEKVRAFLISRGCKIFSDYTFFAEGKYYDFISAACSGGDSYSDWEISFGRDNLKSPSPAFVGKLRAEEQKLRAYLENSSLSRESRDALRERLYRMEAITDAIDGDI